MIRNFASDITPLKAPWHYWGKSNVQLIAGIGLRLWVRDGQGCGVMLTKPTQYGKWEVSCSITGPTDRITTRICLLLWPEQLAVGSLWPPEIDFNESGKRLESHQTLHYGVVDPLTNKHPEIHRSYGVNQNNVHKYGVEVLPDVVNFFCDDVRRTYVPNVADDVRWNMHMRTDPHNAPLDETYLDVISVRQTEYQLL